MDKEQIAEIAERAIRNYFTTPHEEGLCVIITDAILPDPREDYGAGRKFLTPYAERWPFCPKNEGKVAHYFIPISKENLDYREAQRYYIFEEEKEQNPLRKEFANFVLECMAKEQGKEFVPIP